ncbi:MAG: hypothetical protein IJG63_02720 [Oscillospiraceae bacterium]|nr:hypothetical protein [Oscillospiraceae bacterium]
MRKALLCICLICLLSACASKPSPEEHALRLREYYARLENIDMTMKTRADYGERVYEYKLSCAGSPCAGLLQVLEPDNVAGLRARYEDGSTALVFDSAELYTGKIDESGLSPLDAVPAALKAWGEGYIREAWYERLIDTDCIVILTDINNDVQLCTWFDKLTMLPVQADIMRDGYTVVSMEFENVIINE